MSAVLFLSSFSLLFHRQGKLQGCGGERYRFTDSWTGLMKASKRKRKTVTTRHSDIKSTDLFPFSE